MLMLAGNVGPIALPAPTISQITTSNALSPLITPGQPARRVIALIGDSNTVGFSAGVENASGFRLTFQRRIAEAGVKFRMVGLRGYYALNGTGASWGVTPGVDDRHDSPIYILQDWRNDGQAGYRLTQTLTVGSINTGTSTITSNGHALGNGSLILLTSTGTLPTVTGLSPITVNGVSCLLVYVASVATNTFQLTKFDNGAVLTITDAGSGTITIGRGLLELVPALFASYDEAPTDVIIMGGTNDIANLVDTGASGIEATLEAREALYYAAIDAAAPNARKYRIGLLPFTSGAANQASRQAAVVAFNSYLASAVPARPGGKWCWVDAGANVSAADMGSDGTHPTSFGYETYGEAIADSIIAACGIGAAKDRWPYAVRARGAQACVYLSATGHNIHFPAAAALNPGSDSFFFRVWYYPTSLPSGTNAVVQQENPYNTGALLSQSSTSLLLYWHNAAPAIPATEAAVLKRLRWHCIFAFFDFTRQECGLWVNGALAVRTPTTATAITSSTGWYIGGSSLLSALGLYQGALFGHGASLSIEDAYAMAQQDYWHGVDPPGATIKYLISDGSGTSIAGNQGATAGTLSAGASWIASGRYRRPVDRGYVKGRDVLPATVAAAYTCSIDEDVYYDGTASAFAITLPDAVGLDGRRIEYAELTGGTNNVTLTPVNSQTIDGASTLVLSTAGKRGAIESRLGNWNTIR